MCGNLVRGRKIAGASSSVFYLPSLHFKFSLETKHHQTVFVSLDLCESKLSIGLKNEFIKVERKILHSSTSLNLFEIIFQFVSTSLLDEWLIDRCNGNVFAISRKKSWTKLLFCSQKKIENNCFRFEDELSLIISIFHTKVSSGFESCLGVSITFYVVSSATLSVWRACRKISSSHLFHIFHDLPTTQTL